MKKLKDVLRQCSVCGGIGEHLASTIPCSELVAHTNLLQAPNLRPFCYFHKDEDEDKQKFVWPEAVNGRCDSCIPLYTAPPRKEWQGLTDEDLSVCDEDGVILARYWEAKLREKNT